MVILGLIIKRYKHHVVVIFYFFYVKYDGKNCIYIYWKIWRIWWIKYEYFKTRDSYYQWLAATRGLCGNYNSDQSDDFLKLDGTSETDPWLFGDSYKTDPKCIGKARLIITSFINLD